MSPMRCRLRAGLWLSLAVLGVPAVAVALLVAAGPGTPRLAQAQSAPPQAAATTPSPAAGDSAQAADTAGKGAPDAAPAAPAPAAPGPMTSAASGTTAGNAPGQRISWGTDYRTYAKVTGYVNSLEHGNRLGVTYASPAEGATIYRQNAALVRENKSGGFSNHPVGTVIVMETWLKSASGAPTSQGPIFFMRKERGGFDPEGRDWFYGFTDAKLNLIAEGRDGRVTFCRGCHVSVANRDAVFAVDR